MNAEITIESLIDDYTDYLNRYRNLVESSIRKHRFCIERFIEQCKLTDSDSLFSNLGVDYIQGYTTRYSKQYGRGSQHDMFSSLRVFLRYLHMSGYIGSDFSPAVQSRKTWRMSSIPRGISPGHVEELVRTIDTSSVAGKRDYAIIQLLNTYGVRGVHVRRLMLEDILWSDNRIVFRAAKGGREIVQHLTVSVGNSLFRYLSEARPEQSRHKEVFLTCHGKLRSLRFSSNISCMICRRLKSAGIELPEGVSTGSHSFRHAFATRMVCGSQPFKHVSDMLGHKVIDSTMIYTKVDLPAMRHTAAAWPEVTS